MNKAIALEHAIFRRFGPDPAPDKFANVARDYLRAAILGLASNELDEARSCLSRALALNPALLQTDKPLEDIVRKYMPRQSYEAALIFTVSVFADLLPKTRHLKHLKGHLLSELHMREVFLANTKTELNSLLRICHPPLRMTRNGCLTVAYWCRWLSTQLEVVVWDEREIVNSEAPKIPYR